MIKNIIVSPLPLFSGQTVGATVKGYEQQGYVNTPGTWDRKRIYSRGGKLDTGMLFKTANPLYKEIKNPDFISDKDTPKIPKYIPKDSSIPKEIYKWEEMEIKLGIDKSDPEYRNKSLAPNSNFWKEFKVRVRKDGNTNFDISNPLKELEVLYLAGTHEVLPTLGLRGNPDYAGATHYFVDLEAEAGIKEKQSEKKIKAINEYSSATQEMKRRYSRILGLIKSSNPSDILINTNLFDFIDGDEKKNANRSTFLRLVDQYKSRPESVIAHDEFIQARECGLIKKIDGKFYRMSSDNKPGTQIGVDDDSCITYITDMSNSEFRAELREGINSYKNANLVKRKEFTED